MHSLRSLQSTAAKLAIFAITHRQVAKHVAPAVAAAVWASLGAVCACFARDLALLSLLCVHVCPCAVPECHDQRLNLEAKDQSCNVLHNMAWQPRFAA